MFSETMTIILQHKSVSHITYEAYYESHDIKMKSQKIACR